MYKATMIFQSTTAPSNPESTAARTGGWTESYYFDGTITDLRANFLQLCQKRAALLPINTFVIGQRYGWIGGGSSTAGNRFGGSTGLAQDIPQLALQYYVPGVDVPNVSHLTLRGLPDARCVGGEYSPTQAYDASLVSFIDALNKLSFRFKARSLSAIQAQVVTIAVNGIVTVVAPHTFTSNMKVRLLRVRNVATGRPINGVYIIEEQDANTITLRNYSEGSGVGGKIRQDVIIYPPFSARGDRGSVVTRKVGAPLKKYRGRATRRR